MPVHGPMYICSDSLLVHEGHGPACMYYGRIRITVLFVGYRPDEKVDTEQAIVLVYIMYESSDIAHTPNLRVFEEPHSFANSGQKALSS